MNFLLLAFLVLVNREQQDIVTFDYSGNDGCSFTVSVAEPSFRNYEDRWYPVIEGMDVSFNSGEYALPKFICYIPIPPGCEPELSYTPLGNQSVRIPGPLLVTPEGTGEGLETEWIIPNTIPSAASLVSMDTFRMAGTNVAAVTVDPFEGGIAGSIPLEISVQLRWPSTGGGRRIDSSLLRSLTDPGLIYWPVAGATDADSPFWGKPWARMAVSVTGIYAVTGLELEQAGCEITGTSSRSLRVFSGPGVQFDLETPEEEHELIELAVEVYDDGDGIFNQSDTLVFFGQGLERLEVVDGEVQRLPHRYATHNVYWLTWGGEDGLRIDTTAALPDGSPELGDSLSHCIWQEQEYSWVAGQEDRTGWVWTRLFEGIPSYFYFSTLSAAGNGKLTLSIVPENGNTGPHHITLNLNGSVVEDTVISSGYEFLLSVDNIQFDPSMNLLKVTIDQETEALYFNYFKVEYPRILSYAANRMLRFNDVVPGRYNLTLGGAPGEYGLLDLTDPAVPVRIKGQLSGADLDVALDLERNSQLWLSTGDEYYLSPDSIVPSEPGRIIGSGIEGNIAIVVADELMAAAEPLETLYSSRGLSTAIVSSSEVYNEFGQGVRDPGAIRSFFRFTQDSWGEPARSLLLVGDGSYDPLMFITAYPTLIPACILLQGEDGRSIDDLYVIAHAGGVLPEAPISRIPAASPDELTSYLSKVMAYESRVCTGEWENRILLVADDEWGQTTSEFYHTQDCDTLADFILPSSLERVKFYLIEYPWPQGTSPTGDHPEKPDSRVALIDLLSAGCANMFFLGHGSYGQLAHEKLLVSSDVQLINNDSRQPVMVFASCDLAHFDMISANCLAEDFVLQPGSGSIASIGATRKTFPTSNRLLFFNYYEVLFGTGELSIGEALWLAKAGTASYYNSWFYVILGDGGLRSVFPSPAGCSFEVLSDTLFRGRVNTVEGNFRESSAGFLDITESGSYRVYNGFNGGSVTFLRYGSSSYKALITGNDQSFQTSFFLPVQADTGSYSRGSAAGLSDGSTDVAFDEWIDCVDQGGHASDSVPPAIELWIDGFRGESVPVVGRNAVLKALLSDSSGICAMGGGAGRSILLSLDSQGFDVSSYFTYRVNSYTSGELEYPLPELAEGSHRVIMVAWDGIGNSARDTLDFNVTDVSEDLLSSVFVYPNPAEGQRCFNFETSSAGTAEITIYTVSGRSIWEYTASCDEGYNQILWNGLDMDSDEPGSGAYIYRVYFRTLEGASSSFTDILAVIRER